MHTSTFAACACRRKSDTKVAHLLATCRLGLEGCCALTTQVPVQLSPEQKVIRPRKSIKCNSLRHSEAPCQEASKPNVVFAFEQEPYAEESAKASARPLALKSWK